LLGEPLAREIADGLEQRETSCLLRGRTADDEVLLHERVEHVQRGAGDGLCGLQGATAREHREARERRPLA
jgi:hypothetical protein